MKLNKRYSRSIKENLSFYVSASVLTIVTLLVFYLFNIAGTGINKFGDEFFVRNNLEDAEFSTAVPISGGEISELEEKYDIELEAQSYINLNEDDFTARVFARTEKINLYEITEGDDIAADGEIIISEGYADYMNVELGDEITLRDKSYKVVGYFQRPDYLYMLEQTDDAYKNVDSFFLCYLSDSDFQSLGNMPVQYFIKYGGADETQVRKAINDEYIMMSYLSADENPRISMVHTQAEMFIRCSYILLVVLPLISVALICIILSRKVKSEQKMIGTLSALGYKKGRLMLHYAGFAAIPGLAGGILSYLLSVIFAQSYGEMGLADYEPMRAKFSLSPFVGILGIIVPTVMYVIAALIAVYRLLRNDTVAMLNGTVGEKKRLKRLFANSKMSFRRKYALRSLLGNPARSFVVLLGVFLGSFITLFAFSLMDSVKSVSVDMISQTGTYKYQYILNTLKIEEPQDGSAVLVVAFEDKDHNVVTMYGTSKDNPYLNFKDKDGNSIEIDDGYYITSAASYLLGMNAGDSAELYNPLSLEKKTIKISGVIDNDMQKGIFTSRENASELSGFESGSYNAVMSDKKLDMDSSEVAKTVKTSSISEQCDTILEMMRAMIYVCLLLGAIICIAAIYVAVNMMMTENRNNISMLKVLGYSDKRINSLVLNTNHLLLPLGILISIPVIFYVQDIFMKWLASYIGMIISAIISPISYVIDILLTSVCYFGSVYIIRRKTKKVDMVESLKDNRE